ncbi:S-methyl-5-thioribose-1-phosphate isomerase [Paenibacillus woosongensis]|uniref:Methylthioribose-1-phosphate isomerase n=2 Tax=Paenibacillus woosongensis TaxID=307580 RepID=A0AA95KX91_9BACL|nr:S-methyl-5-thioribose-1-phosphate isomerase [Paenibacillus woosongensis]WHX50635.1 S-methyl-5-thioribose-1-phosphate isomerase [Paenibacillus woosongensis]
MTTGQHSGISNSSPAARQSREPLLSLRWKDGKLLMLDQRLLPEEIVFLELTTPEEVWDGIHAMKVRGAPAIGIAAAYGVVLGANACQGDSDNWLGHVTAVAEHLATSRPTAVNLFWALDRMKARAAQLAAQHADQAKRNEGLLAEAIAIHREDEEVCRKIGEHALPLFASGMGVLTHCNAGGLATAKYGTALAPFYLAQEQGIDLKIYADETRPVLQGARLTAFELQQAGIDVTLLCDNMAGLVMSKGWIDAVIVGTDRIAANGDVANKIGTYSLAVLAKAHNIPFYVASPLSTIDLETESGQLIPIEERPEYEVTEGFGKRTAPSGVKVFNPSFDVTPHHLITAIITEKGIVKPPFKDNLAALFEKAD